jgi:hypothetical protein
VKTFATLISGINQLQVPNVAQGLLDLGSFKLGDPRLATGDGKVVFSKTITAHTPPPTAPEQQNQIGASFFLNASNVGLDIPILENPTNLFPLLLGDDVQIFTLSIPKLSVHMAATLPIPIWPAPPIAVTLRATLDASFTGTFGYDTSGLRQGNLLEGFYMKDVAFSMTASVGAVVGLALPFGFALGPTVTFSASTALALTNGNPNNKQDYNTTTIRGTDFPYIHINPRFNVSGKVSIELDIYGNCVFGIQLGAISVDQNEHVTVTGFHLGC